MVKRKMNDMKTKIMKNIDRFIDDVEKEILARIFLNDDDDVFPIGETGNTKENYNPTNDGDITFGGSVYGELEVSKNVLEADISNETITTYS